MSSTLNDREIFYRRRRRDGQCRVTGDAVVVFSTKHRSGAVNRWRRERVDGSLTPRSATRAARGREDAVGRRSALINEVLFELLHTLSPSR